MALAELAARINGAIENEAPALFEALSPLGRAAALPELVRRIESGVGELAGREVRS